MEETRFRSFGQIITNLFKEGQKGILWLYLVFIPGTFVLLLMINSPVSEPIAEVHLRISVFTKTRDLWHEFNYYGGITFKFYLHEFARNLEQKCFGVKYFMR